MDCVPSCGGSQALQMKLVVLIACDARSSNDRAPNTCSSMVEADERGRVHALLFWVRTSSPFASHVQVVPPRRRRRRGVVGRSTMAMNDAKRRCEGAILERFPMVIEGTCRSDVTTYGNVGESYCWVSVTELSSRMYRTSVVRHPSSHMHHRMACHKRTSKNPSC